MCLVRDYDYSVGGHMQIVVEILGAWIFVSLSIGLILTWAFFYPERRARSLQEAHDRWVDTHPTSPLGMMPAWLRREDTTTGSDVERDEEEDLCRFTMRSR